MPRHRYTLLLAGPVLAALLCAPPAWCQDDPAKLDQEARSAFEKGDFKSAAAKFEAAFRNNPVASLKYNAAFAWDKAGELARAADGYQAAIGFGGLAEDQAVATRERLAELKRQLAYISIPEPVGGTITVAHVQDMPLPAFLHLTLGKHHVVVKRSDGTKSEQDINVLAGQALTLKVEANGLPLAPLEDDGKGTSKPPPPPVEDKPVESSGGSVVPWVVAGGAVVAAGAAIFLGTQALKARDDFDASGHRDADARDRAVSLRLWTNVAWGVAAVGAGVATVMFINSGNGKEAASKPRVELRLGVASVSGRLSF